jgi:hypothetical protein
MSQTVEVVARGGHYSNSVDPSVLTQGSILSLFRISCWASPP